MGGWNVVTMLTHYVRTTDDAKISLSRPSRAREPTLTTQRRYFLSYNLTDSQKASTRRTDDQLCWRVTTALSANCKDAANLERLVCRLPCVVTAKQGSQRSSPHSKDEFFARCARVQRAILGRCLSVRLSVMHKLHGVLSKRMNRYQSVFGTPASVNLSYMVSSRKSVYLSKNKAHILPNVRPNFTHVARGRGALLLWRRRAIRYVLPVLRMTLYFHIKGST